MNKAQTLLMQYFRYPKTMISYSVQFSIGTKLAHLYLSIERYKHIGEEIPIHSRPTNARTTDWQEVVCDGTESQYTN